MMDSVKTDEARAALAAAIAERDAAGNRLEAARGAVERVSDLLAAALVKLEARRAAVIEAEETAPQRILEMASSGSLTLDRHLKQARSDAASAEDDVAGLRSAIATARAAVAEAERSLMLKQIPVDACCKPVLAADLGRILAAAEGLKRKFDETRATLSFLSAALPPGSPLRLRIDDAIECAPARNLEPPAEWLKARADLMRDARAPLPSEIN
jgi:hypothetical protein